MVHVRCDACKTGKMRLMSRDPGERRTFCEDCGYELPMYQLGNEHASQASATDSDVEGDEPTVAVP